MISNKKTSTLDTFEVFFIAYYVFTQSMGYLYYLFILFMGLLATIY